jgi:hypothetical protein
MAGEGFYNEHSRPQHVAGEEGIPLLVRAAESIQLDPSRGVVVADYGASQGRNSLDPMRALIRTLRGRLAPGTPISIVHTDLPTNDFAALFTTLETDPQSYLRAGTDVFAYAAGRSFYEQIFPPAHISIGWTSITVHWLSSVPVPIRYHIFSTLADPVERSAYAARAAADWRQFLVHRARELTAGGRLVVVGSGADDHGRSGAEHLMDLANGVLAEMVAEDSLRPEEYQRMVLPMYYRTQDEFTEALQDRSLSGSLALEECSETALSDPLWARYQASGDAAEYAASAAEFLRAFSEPSLFGFLAAERSEAEVSRLADEFYARVRSAIERRPQDAQCAWRLVLLSLAKRG